MPVHGGESGETAMVKQTSWGTDEQHTGSITLDVTKTVAERGGRTAQSMGTGEWWFLGVEELVLVLTLARHGAGVAGTQHWWKDDKLQG